MDMKSYLRFQELPDADEHGAVSLQKSINDCLFNTEAAAPNTNQNASEEAQQQLDAFAIIDAAKLPYILTGLLSTSGLTYASLFQGEAQEELEEFAPYIVRLEKDNNFARKLLSGNSSANGLWDKKIGVFFRSSASFDELRSHFRKFTRIRDQSDNWLYFRFWEPNIAHACALLKDDIDSPLVRVWLKARITNVLFPNGENALHCDVSEPNAQTNLEPVRLRPIDLDAMKNTKRWAFLHGVAVDLEHDHNELWQHTNLTEISEIYQQARECGYTIEQAAFDYIRCSIALKIQNQTFRDIEALIDPNLTLSPLNRGKRSWAYISDTYLANTSTT